MRSCGRSRRTRCCGPRSPPSPCSTGRPTATRLRHLLDRGTRLVPRMRQRVRGNPLSVAPPRWEVDPHFDLDYHLRWVRAGGDRDLRSVLDLAEPMAMQGFDRARPLWEMVVVDRPGRRRRRPDHEDPPRHHRRRRRGADRAGAVRARAATGPLAEMPDAPEAEVMGQLGRFVDAFEHERRRNLGIAKRSAGTVAGGGRGSALGDPVGTAERVGETAASIARLAAPANEPLSPLMTGRSLSVHFDTVVVPLAEAKAAAKAAGGRLNDAFLAATAGGLAPLPRGAGRSRSSALRMSMPINLRTRGRRPTPPATSSPRPASRSRSTSTTRSRPCGPMRDLVAAQRAEPALALVEPLARLLNRLPTSMTHRPVRRHAQGRRPGGQQRARRADPALHRRRPDRGHVRPRPDGRRGGQPDAALATCDDVHIGINVDPAAVTEPERFVALLPRRLGRGPGRRPPARRPPRSSSPARRRAPVPSAAMPCPTDRRRGGRGRGPGRGRRGDHPGPGRARVVLVDKATFPRDKICGDGLTTGALRDPRGARRRAAGGGVVDAGRRHPRLVARRGTSHDLPAPRRPGAYAAVARADRPRRRHRRPWPARPAPRSSRAPR